MHGRESAIYTNKAGNEPHIQRIGDGACTAMICMFPFHTTSPRGLALAVLVLVAVLFLGLGTLVMVLLHCVRHWCGRWIIHLRRPFHMQLRSRGCSILCTASLNSRNKLRKSLKQNNSVINKFGITNIKLPKHALNICCLSRLTPWINFWHIWDMIIPGCNNTHNITTGLHA